LIKVSTFRYSFLNFGFLVFVLCSKSTNHTYIIVPEFFELSCPELKLSCAEAVEDKLARIAGLILSLSTELDFIGLPWQEMRRNHIDITNDRIEITAYGRYSCIPGLIERSAWSYRRFLID